MYKFITINILLIAFIVIVNGISFPSKFGDTYSTFVAYSNYEKGYTISHKEYSNGPLKVVRFEAGNITISKTDTNTLYMYDARNSDNCNSYSLLSAHELFLPSYQMIPALIQSDTFNFANYSIIDRGINCSLFTSTIKSQIVFTDQTVLSNIDQVNISYVQSQNNTKCLEGVDASKTNISGTCSIDTSSFTVTCTFNNSKDSCSWVQENNTRLNAIPMANSTWSYKNTTTDVTQTKYFYLDISARFPIRLIISSVDTQNKTSTNEIDWIDWIESKDQQLSLYDIPKNCPLYQGSFSPFFINDTKSVSSDSPTSVTGLPLGFSLVLEEEMQDVPVNTIVWNSDFSNSYESIEQDTPNGGDIITILSQKTANFTFNTFTLDCKTTDVPNPFTSDIRRNIVYRILHELVSYEWKFQSRSVYRSIDVDIYTASVNMAGYPYNFSLAIYMVAPGWQFPGRYGMSPDVRIPLAIESNYTGDSSKGRDRWDIYVFTPQSMPENYYNLSTQLCYPQMPTQYNSSVYVNYGDIGATYYFNETFDSNRTYYHAIGKFGSGPYDVGIFTNSSNFTYVTGPSCTNYNLSSVVNYTISDRIYESIRVLNRGPKFGATSFVNNSMIDGKNISVWKSAIISGDYFDTIDNKTYTQNSEFYYFWSVQANGQFYPFRFIGNYQIVDSFSSTSIRNFSVFTEWISFQVGGQVAVSVPATCKSSNSSSNLAQVISMPIRNFAPKPIDSIQPEIPKAFTTLVEIERVLINQNSSASTSQRYLVQWKYDSQQLAESFVIYNPDGSSKSIMMCYVERMGDSLTAFSMNGAPFSWFGQPMFLNPLVQGLGSANFDGKIGTQIIYSNSNFIKSSKISNPRPTVSGVLVDQWTTDNGTLQFSWYPVGWQYPMNPVNKYRIPMGAYRVNPSNSLQAQETWKFLQFTYDDSRSDWAKVCVNATKLKPSTFDTGLSNVAIALIIVFCSLSTILIGGLIFCVIKRRAIVGKQQPGHILLEERNEMNHNLHDDRDYDDVNKDEDY